MPDPLTRDMKTLTQILEGQRLIPQAPFDQDLALALVELRQRLAEQFVPLRPFLGLSKYHVLGWLLVNKPVDPLGFAIFDSRNV